MISGAECLLLFTMVSHRPRRPFCHPLRPFGRTSPPPDRLGPIFVPKAPNPPVPTDRSLSIAIPKLLNEAVATSKQKVIGSIRT